MDFKQLLQTKEYDFLRTNEHIGGNIILLGLGGSHAYGTNTKDSDIDIRGIALNSKSDLIGLSSFEQVVHEGTDTTVYSFNKMIKLLLNSNPNVIEVLGLKPEHYLYVTNIGQELIDNRHMFLSQKCIQSFGGYANQQLHRLKNGIDKKKDDKRMSKHMMHLIRLYIMCIDILEKEEIVAYRENERDLLMDIRNGVYLTDGVICGDFWDILRGYEWEFEYAKLNTNLPKKPNFKRVEEFVMSINERVIRGNV